MSEVPNTQSRRLDNPSPSVRDPAVTSRIMAAVRRRDTRPEIALRRALFARGARFRVDFSGAPGRPDVAFPRARVAVFVDGAMWHGAGWKERGFSSMEEQFGAHANGEFWVKKIRRNMARDAEVNVALRSAGWEVIRVLDTEVAKELDGIVERVMATVRSRRLSSPARS
jgi:DNA mismatch endonuclease, patch repair protein